MIAMIEKIFKIVYLVFASSLITQMVLCLIVGEMEITRQIMFVAARVELPVMIVLIVIRAIAKEVKKKKDNRPEI